MVERKETFRLASEKNAETETMLELQQGELDENGETIKTKQSDVDEQLK